MKALFFLFTLSLLSMQLEAFAFHELSNSPWGADSELCTNNLQHGNSRCPQASGLSRSQKSCVSMIRFFQIYISPIDGPRSSFYPTSSQYALEAIRKYGVLKGIALGCDRLMRENSEMWVYETTDKYGIERKLDPVR